MNKVTTITYVCDFCGTVLSDKYDMEKHERTCASNPVMIAKKELETNGKQLFIVVGRTRVMPPESSQELPYDVSSIFGIYESADKALALAATLQNGSVVKYYANNKCLLQY